jgi:aspartate aminotransferase
MPDSLATHLKLADRVQRISVSATLAVLAEAEKLKAQGVDVVDFGPGEPDFATPDPIKQAAVQALEQNFTKYTPAAGIPELRESICDWHRRELGSHYRPAECLVTAGGKHGIFNALGALINPGDRVLLPVPYWVSFPEIVHYVGGEVVPVPTEEAQGFRLTVEAVRRAWQEGVKLIILNSPCNPSGAIIAREAFAGILELCRERGAWLLSDECYSHFIYSGTPFSAASLGDSKAHLIVVGSLSKTFAMTGWRLGYVLAPEPLVQAMTRLQSHSSNPTSISQKAALQALRGPMDSAREMLAEYGRRRELVIRGLNNIPNVNCADPQGAFYAYPNVGSWMRQAAVGSTTDLARRLLQQAHVAVVPGEAFGTQEHLRISYATSVDRIQEGLTRLKKFFTH